MNAAAAKRTAYCHTDAHGNVIAEHAADDAFYAASTLKLGLAVAVLRQVDSGLLDLNATIPSRHRFASAVPGAEEFDFVGDEDEIDDGFPDQGIPMTIADCLARTIEHSSNEGSNMLTELVGYDAVNAALHDAGAVTARVDRLVGDLAARASGLTLTTSARDLARLMHATITGAILSPENTGAILSPESTALLMGYLRAQKYPLIVAEDSPVTDWGAKCGWVTGIRHDVAWFVRPGESEPEILAVCTEGFEPEDALLRIREIADEAFRPRVH